MRAILGLGNPGKKYEDTKHNIGFKILDLFAEKHKLQLSPGKGDFWFIESTLSSYSFVLVKPVTYMNRSGLAAKEICERYNIAVEDLLVITDDIHLPSGKIRIRKSGGDGGHNGLKSLIYNLESDQFPRLRFGVGNNYDEGDLADYVLSKFDNDTVTNIQSAINLSVSLIEEFVLGGTRAMLNLFSKSSAQGDNSKQNSEKDEN